MIERFAAESRRPALRVVVAAGFAWESVEQVASQPVPDRLGAMFEVSKNSLVEQLSAAVVVAAVYELLEPLK